jgi:hypothetical protein
VSEADSPVAKPRDRWRAPTQTRVAKASLGSTCRGKALRAEQAVSFDEEAGEAVLAIRRAPGDRGTTEGEKERQRSLTGSTRG